MIRWFYILHPSSKAWQFHNHWEDSDMVSFCENFISYRIFERLCLKYFMAYHLNWNRQQVGGKLWMGDTKNNYLGAKRFEQFERCQMCLVSLSTAKWYHNSLLSKTICCLFKFIKKSANESHLIYLKIFFMVWGIRILIYKYV